MIGQSLNILIVFLLTGLWHGIAIEFALWGLLHGLFIALENLFLNRLLRNTFRPIRHIYVLSALMLTWLIFRAPDLNYVGDFVLLLFGKHQEAYQLSFSATSPLPFIEPSFILAFAAGILFALPIGSFIQPRIDRSLALRIVADIILLILFVLSVGVMTSSQFLPGIYERF